MYSFTSHPLIIFIIFSISVRTLQSMLALAVGERLGADALWENHPLKIKRTLAGRDSARKSLCGSVGKSHYWCLLQSKIGIIVRFIIINNAI